MENKELIFGRNPVLEYLRASGPAPHAELYVANTAHGKIIEEIVTAAKEKKVTVSPMDREFFARLGSSSRHQGVALKLQVPDPTADGAGMEGLFARSAGRKGVLVLLDQITDPHNTGSIIRTAEALGCDGVIIPKARSSGITSAVIKASAGATAHIEIQQISNVASFLDEAKKHGFWIIGTADAGNRDLPKLGMVRPAVVIIGSEDSGMRRLTAEKCDYIVRIPLAGKISSLNASVAAGIVLYQIMHS
ncbi:MAG TPA: 23S rRNA (guanosine(2251)-2'-O)-methyltransferase RlmB [Spirochaetota bacterium]|nr:23S rRNA (guanosine(2251)-2'-O)-methyltransferase RlmB [Spirochaetota bacterium]HPC42065.1 23S rRNA (guanosine(2251)-2'-O)-methyltransferase RlmB [Spirochaetota bacterium]HPL15985.1 23S rRNA (guanosine(2251)-2'-O)-methyltransferase RlmB [Spirochaetota bacterium]HQF09019.1 23S rRNA (guanosine(2251)-2'-O)-methyltransferase RlmB [Spirochaetota bacterium]HQH97907.1 23S rRNA (guanosine(2251)-2'-O)-methyltransferase RlmB [Spirochaetota bacterium]